MIGEIHWVLWLIGAGSGGVIVKVIADWLANKLKGDTEKGVDIVSLTSQIATVFENTLRVTTEANARDRAILEGKLYKLEARVESISIELDSHREIISSAYDCSLLKGNPDFQCPVIINKKTFNNDRVDLINSLRNG